MCILGETEKTTIYFYLFLVWVVPSRNFSRFFGGSSFNVSKRCRLSDQKCGMQRKLRRFILGFNWVVNEGQKDRPRTSKESERIP